MYYVSVFSLFLSHYRMCTKLLEVLYYIFWTFFVVSVHWSEKNLIWHVRSTPITHPQSTVDCLIYIISVFARLPTYFHHIIQPVFMKHNIHKISQHCHLHGVHFTNIRPCSSPLYINCCMIRPLSFVAQEDRRGAGIIFTYSHSVWQHHAAWPLTSLTLTRHILVYESQEETNWKSLTDERAVGRRGWALKAVK